MKNRQLFCGMSHVSLLVRHTSCRILLMLASLLFSGAGVRAVPVTGPVAVATLPASGQSNNVATLNGTVNPNGPSAYGWFNWGPGANNYNQQTAPVSVGGGFAPMAISNTLSGLTPGVIYHAQASGSNASGVVVNGADVMFGTPAVTLLGGSTVTNLLGTTFSDAGAAALDAPLAIAAGGFHSLALKSDGTVAAWGLNLYGETNMPAGLSNVVAIAGGAYHSLALKSDGTVVVWGAGTNYNPSDSIDYGQSIIPAGLSNVVAIAGGGVHSLALKSDGTVVAWGAGTSYNPSDNADFGQSIIPAGLSNVVAISAGLFHSLVLKSDGTVVAWGLNLYGETNVPAGLSNVVAIAAGAYHSLALKSDGTLVGWGDVDTNMLAGLSNVVAIAAGASHSLALKRDGTVFAWGAGMVRDPSDFIDFGQSMVPAGLSNVVAIAGGARHSLAMLSDGSVVGWGAGTTNDPSDGYGDFGQSIAPAGLSTLAYTVTGSVDTTVPGTYTLTYTATNSLGGVNSVTRTVTVLPPPAQVVTLPATGQSNDVATLNGTVNPSGFTASGWFNWGLEANNYNQQTAAVSVGSGNAAVAINNTLSGLMPGVIYHGQASGSNASGVIINGADVMFGSPALTLLGGATVTNILGMSFSDPGATALDAPLAIGAGGYHSLVLKSDRTVVGWGAGTTNNPTDRIDFGQSIVPTGLSNVVAVAGGGYHSLALKSDGTVAAWGYDAYGQADVPTGLSNVVAVAGGVYHSLAAKSDGTVVVWGYDAYGQADVPAGLSNVVAVAGGLFHSVALKSDGTVVAWGAGTTNDPTDAVDFGQSIIPTGLSNVVAIAAGQFHSVALKNDGSVVAWGYDDDGEIDLPAGLSNVVAIAAGGYHSLALKKDGTVVAWGGDDFGDTDVPAGLSNVVAIAAGEDHNLVLESDGTVLAWGYGNNGQTNVPAGLSTLAYTVSGSVNPTVPGTYTLTYTAANSLSGVNSATRTVIVPAASYPSAFLVSAPTNVTAGVPFNFTVTAVDQFSNVVTGYTGTVHFTSTDGLAILPVDSTLTNGVGTFPATLKTAGNMSLTATDTATNSLTGSANVTVVPSAPNSLIVSAPGNATAGVPFQFSVTIVDAFNNVVTGNSDPLGFDSTDGYAVLPLNRTLTNGVGTFSATLKTGGSMQLFAIDENRNYISGYTYVTVVATTATHFVVQAPASATAGSAFSFTVTAEDQFNNTVTSYSDSVHFTSSDAAASLPADSTLANGVGTFTATLKTAGTNSLTATDTVSNSVTGSANVTVSAAAASQFLVVTPSTMKARIPSTFSVTAQDPYGNMATTYAGIVHFTSTDALANLPANSALTNGVGTFSVTMQTAGNQTLTGTDTLNTSITGTSAAFEVLDLKIAVQPANQDVLFSSNASFSVGVSGTAPFAYQWYTNGAAVNGGTNDTLTVPNVTLTTATNYQVVITNGWGSVTSSIAQLVVSGLFTYQTNQAHTAVLNPLTGLYEESIVVTNAAGPISGVQIFAGGLPSRVSLYDATGTNNGMPYAQFNVVMQPGATNTFMLEFFNPYRLTFTNTIDVVALAAGTNATPGVKVSTQGIAISQVYTDNSIAGSPRFTLAFASTPGQSYQVFYSDDSMSTWQLASTITATSTWTIWTELLPPAQVSRFFKVIPFSSNNP